jgi:hypothetical protein
MVCCNGFLEGPPLLVIMKQNKTVHNDQPPVMPTHSLKGRITLRRSEGLATLDNVKKRTQVETHQRNY